MARAYRLILEPEDIETREVYFIEPDELDDLPELTREDGDAFDIVLSDNEGYYLDSVERVDLELAKKNAPYEG
jgi:hypothetical protein